MPNKKRKRPAAASRRKAATRLHLFNDADDPPPRQRETRPPDPHAKYATASQVRLRYGGRSEMWLYRILKDDPDFPRFIKIGRFRFFDIAQLEAYEARRAARCAPQPKSRGDGHEQSHASAGRSSPDSSLASCIDLDDGDYLIPDQAFRAQFMAGGAPMTTACRSP